jgi:hypothetical protein
LQDVFKIEIKKIFKSPSAQKTWKWKCKKVF